VHQGLQILADNGLTFDLHSYPDTIKYIPDLARGVPELRMVIDHLAKPYYHEPSAFKAWCEDMSAAAKFPNVYCKLSGMINEVTDWNVEKFQPYVDHCIKEFGVARCFYGSDYPVCKQTSPDVQYRSSVQKQTPSDANYSDVVRLLEGLLTGLTDQEKDDIFYNNAKKFYNID